MKENYAEDFGPFEGAIWLNCAHQGALPRVAAAEAEEAIAWKRAPWNLTTERFSSVPQRLKQALGRLIGAPAEEIILGNSASYGLHLMANGMRWQAGDEVLLMHGDFPSDILPWLGLERRGVRVRLIRPKRAVLDPEELLGNITGSTKLLCLTLAHSFSGHAVDAEALGEICRVHGVAFVMNISQALGARRFDVFGTANFFNFKPWTASIEYLLSQGLENIEEYDQRLVTRLVEGLDPVRYALHSPRSGPSRSTLVFISHKRPERNNAIYEELRARKIFIAHRAGKLRLSPHLYNTRQEIDEALSVLNSM